MPKSTTALLLINLFLLVCGCASNPKSDAVKAEIAQVSNPYFSNPSVDYVYRTKIAVYGNDLNGILIVKKINDSIHRAVLTTDFGNTLLDFEVGQTIFTVNSIVEDLDRKIVVNTLRDDFRLLFRQQFPCSGAGAANGTSGYECIEGRNYFRITTSGPRLESIRQGSARKDKVHVSFQSENDTFADKITIRHHNIELRIEMRHFTP